MHIAVFGAGAVGGYFGGRLAQSGQRVTFIARGAHLQAMLSSGLRVDSLKGNFTLQPVAATSDPASVKDVDAVLVCVKAWHIPEAGRAILPMLGEDTFIVPLSNGIEAPSQLAEILSPQRVLGGLCGILSHIASPGYIQHTGSEPYVKFGELDDHPSQRTRDLLHCFLGAGVKSEIPDNIQAAIWEKFMFVSALSGIGAITRVPVGIFRSQDGTRSMLIRALQECYSLAHAMGIPLPAELVTQTMARIDALTPDGIASMHRDILNGRPSELEAQNGAIVRLGAKLDLPTPVHSFLYHSLQPQERLARAELQLPG